MCRIFEIKLNIHIRRAHMRCIYKIINVLLSTILSFASYMISRKKKLYVSRIYEISFSLEDF